MPRKRDGSNASSANPPSSFDGTAVTEAPDRKRMTRSQIQKRYRERRKVFAEYPNLVRMVKQRRERLKNDPHYQYVLREQRLLERRERRHARNNGVDRNIRIPGKVMDKLVPGARLRPADFRAVRGMGKRKGKAGRNSRGSIRRPLGDPGEPVQDLRPIEAMYAAGLTHDQVAGVVGVSGGVWRRWVEVSPSLNKYVRNGCELATSKVVKSLYRQALGYTIPEEKIFVDNKTGRVTKVRTNKYYPPSTVASIFWLKNKVPEHWRDSKEIEHKGDQVINRDLKIVVVSPPKDNDSKEQVIDTDFRVLPAVEDKTDKTGEK